MFDFIAAQKSVKHLEISDEAIKCLSWILFASYLVVAVWVAHDFIARQTVYSGFRRVLCAILEDFSNSTALVPRDCHVDPHVIDDWSVELTNIKYVKWSSTINSLASPPYSSQNPNTQSTPIQL